MPLAALDYSADDCNSFPSPRNISPNYCSQETPSPLSSPILALLTSLPAALTDHASYFQGSEVPYPQHSATPVSSQPSTVKYNFSWRVGTNEEPTTSSQTFHYDSNYRPPPDKIAGAQKATRFAVGALASDDVVVAVDFLKKSFELLTNPSVSK